MSAFLPPPALTCASSRTAGCGCGDGLRSAPGRGSRQRGRNRSRSPSGISESAENVGARGNESRVVSAGRRPARLACAAVLALALAGCSSSILSVGAPPAGLPGAPQTQQAQRQQPPTPTSREHQRILAAYNGAYDDAKL